jgi:hypothetical protein
MYEIAVSILQQCDILMAVLCIAIDVWGKIEKNYYWLKLLVVDWCIVVFIFEEYVAR